MNFEKMTFFKQGVKWFRFTIVLPMLLALLPVIVVFFEEKPIPYAIIILLLLFFFREDKHIDLNSISSLIKPYLIIIGVYLMYTLVSIDVFAGVKVLERQVSLLLIPLVVFSYNFKEFDFKVFFITFIYAMLLAGIISLIILICFAFNHAEWIETMNSTSGNQTYLQFKFPHLIGVHPTYWSYLLIIANIILLCRSSLKIELKKWWVIILLLLFNINMFYLSARTPMAINILIHIIVLMVYLNTKKASLIKIIGFLCVLCLFVIFASQLPLLKFKINSIINDDRIYLWPKAIDLIKENYFVLGEGLGQGKELMLNYIIEKGDPRKIYNGFDLHNQYLTNYLDMGILGILSLLYLIFYPLSQIRKRLTYRNLPIVGFSLLFFLALFTETSLYLIKGIIIFAVFSSVFLKINQIDIIAKKQ